MRKEQKKTLQEQQKLNPVKHKDGRVSDITEMLEDIKGGERVFNKNNDLDDAMTQMVSNDDSHKSSSQTPGTRPLVPPGFKSTILEKISSTRSVTHSHEAEVYSCLLFFFFFSFYFLGFGGGVGWGTETFSLTFVLYGQQGLGLFMIEIKW